VAKVAGTKKTERAGVNAFRALMESARHIVQEIDGGNDYGEDFYLSLTRGGRRTGDIVSVQIKSGLKYRRSSGYAIPCSDHADDWTRSRIPVIGIVYDPEIRKLYWVNITEYLLVALGEGRRPRAVPVKEDAVLDEKTLAGFVSNVTDYIARNDAVRYLRTGFTRSVVAHLAQKRMAVKDRPVPVGGRVDHSAARTIDFMDRHESKFLKASAGAAFLIMITVWCVMAPGLAKGADKTHFSGWVWVFIYFGVLAGLIWNRVRDHTRFGRRLMYFHHVLLFVGWFVSLYEEGEDSLFVNPVVESIFYGTVVTCAQFGAFFTGLHYCQRELSRRRRLKMAYGVEMIVDQDQLVIDPLSADGAPHESPSAAE
jgi:hypothetical protein